MDGTIPPFFFFIRHIAGLRWSCRDVVALLLNVDVNVHCASAELKDRPSELMIRYQFDVLRGILSS